MMTAQTDGTNLAQEATTNLLMETDPVEMELLAPERAATAPEVTKTNLPPARTVRLAAVIAWEPSRTRWTPGALRVDHPL